MTSQAQILPGTLDLLILKAVSLGPLHGYGVLLRIEQITRGALLAEQGALYPALNRLEHQGLLESEWGTSENNRRAKFYRLTADGRKRFREETASWNRLAVAIGAAVSAKPQEDCTGFPGCVHFGRQSGTVLDSSAIWTLRSDSISKREWKTWFAPAFRAKKHGAAHRLSSAAPKLIRTVSEKRAA